MADEEVKVEEVKTETTETPTQEELPLAAEAEKAPEAEPVEAKAEEKKEEPKKEEPKVDWRDKELKSKYRKLKEVEQQLADEKARREAAEALAAKFNQIKPEDQFDPSQLPAAAIEAAKKQLQQEQEAEKFNRRAAEAETRGREIYKEDWANAINNLELKGGFGHTPETMRVIMATKNPEKVFYELGKNPDKYDELMSMPFEERILEVAELAKGPIQAKPVSNAPAPVNPVGGRAAPATETLRDDMPDDQWYRVRAQLRKKREGGDPTKFKAAQY